MYAVNNFLMDVHIETITIAGSVQGLHLETTIEKGEVLIGDQRMLVKIAVEIWMGQEQEDSIRRRREMWVQYGPLQVTDLQEEIRSKLCC